MEIKQKKNFSCVSFDLYKWFFFMLMITASLENDDEAVFGKRFRKKHSKEKRFLRK